MRGSYFIILYGSAHELSVLAVKPVLSGHSKIDKIKVSKTDCSLFQVESVT